MTHTQPPGADIEPMTDHIRARVRKLRKATGMSQAELAEKVTDHGLDWGRTTVAKLEAGGRKAITVQELFILALVFDVPPALLLADPREPDQVPITANKRVDAWQVLLWLVGIVNLGESGRGGERWQTSTMVRAGDRVVQASGVLSRPPFDEDYYAAMDPDDPETASRARERDRDQRRDALHALAGACSSLLRAGTPLPSFIPMDVVRQQAVELDIDIDGIEKSLVMSAELTGRRD